MALPVRKGCQKTLITRRHHAARPGTASPGGAVLHAFEAWECHEMDHQSRSFDARRQQ
jgi:hypothetical protein